MSNDTIQPKSARQNPTADRLDLRISKHMSDVVEQTELYSLLSDPSIDPKFAAALVRHTMVESFSFTPKICATTMRAIGKMPFSTPQPIKQAFHQVFEELPHGEMALNTFKSLGGDEKWARSRRMTPASFALCAACDNIVDEISGHAYLGYMYPFESMTPILAEKAMGWLEAKGIGSDKREFIDVHAVDDIAHQRALRDLIGRIVSRCPEASEEIEYASEVLFSVYPAPIWEAVVVRAREEVR